MSAFLRRASIRQLLLAVCATIGLVGGGTAIAVAASSSAQKPPARTLASAVHTALVGAQQVHGVTATITFTDNLIASSSIQGADPLLAGATGRLWASSDGHVRLELQAANGDVEILSDGKTVTVSDPGSNSVYEVTLPQATSSKHAVDTVPGLATIENALTHLGAAAIISSPVPSNVAGRPAYTVQVSPKHDGGLLGAVQLAWDAANGTPLRLAVYAAGESSPALELKATDISFGPVDSSVFAISPPAGAKVVNLTSRASGTAGSTQSQVNGAVLVQQHISFHLAAPASLVGLPQQQVRLVSSGASSGALVTYGKGLGGLAVLELPSDSTARPATNGSGLNGSLPSVSIGGATGHELATALGTVVTFDRGGVAYTVIGSVPPAAAEAAARALS
jgi:outer membrane lipoprotein-sorting protein